MNGSQCSPATGGGAQEHAAVPCTASLEMAARRLQGSFLNKVITYGSGAGRRTHLGRSRAVGSTGTRHAAVAQYLRASIVAAAQDGGQLASSSKTKS
jgi:hypothetical protein